MTSNEIYARVKDNEFVNTPTHRVNVIDENGVIRLSRPCWGLDMAESIAADREGEIDGWAVEIVEQENRDEIQAYWDKENTETPNPTNNTPAMNANETLTSRQNEVGYYDEDYNDCFFSSVDEAFSITSRMIAKYAALFSISRMWTDI